MPNDPKVKSDSVRRVIDFYGTEVPYGLLSAIIENHLLGGRDDEDLADVHIFPGDLQMLKETEGCAEVYSVPCGHPDKGQTVPLFERQPWSE